MGHFIRTLSIMMLLLVAAVGTVGCVDSLERRSVYDDERYLCEASDAAAWTHLVDQCVAERCAGIIHLRGQLQEEEITIGSAIRSAAFRTAFVEGDDTAFLSRVDLVGQGPYFLFTLKFKSLGGPADETHTATRELEWYEGATNISPPIDAMEDNLGRADLRIENGKENAGFRALDGSGSLLITRQAPGELAGSFSAQFESSDNQMSGCFHAFATEVRSESL